jgi:X-linked retinitis pigmentosa GTPase regulator
MKKRFQIVSSSILVLIMLTPPLFAQEDEPASSTVPVGEEQASEEAEAPAGQEVEINEDNYRQFMELKDAMRQRDVIPENIFKPGSGLQKLDKLPEESQKHLRNQLREIIVQGDPWQPGDEETEYPYTPSAAAGTNPALEKQELEAWGELVESYHDRESQIYENSSGSQAARGSEQGSSGSSQNGTGQPGSNSQNGEGSQGQQPGQEGNPDQTAGEGTFSVNGSSDPNAKNTAGVSQNAMEFLQGTGQSGGGPGNARQGDSSTPSNTQAQVRGDQQNGAEQSTVANNGTPNPAGDTNAESTAGTSQNAMEFLAGNAGQGQGQGAGESGTASSGENQGQGETQEGEQGKAQQNGQEDGQADGQEGGQEDGQDDGQDGEQEGDQDNDQGDSQEGGQNNEQAQDEQQTEVPEESDSNIPPSSSDPASPAEPDEESTDGASQNALEYLTGEGGQTDEGTSNEPVTTQPSGTLTIQDLLNARGVGESTGTNPASNRPGEEQQPDENIPDNDGGG